MEDQKEITQLNLSLINKKNMHTLNEKMTELRILIANKESLKNNKTDNR